MTDDEEPRQMTRQEKYALGKKRKAKVAERTKSDNPADDGKADVQPRVFATPITVGNADPSRLFEVQLPNPEVRETDGRRHLRDLVNRLQSACGVIALVAHGQLMANHRDAPDRHNLTVALIAKHSTQSHDHLMRLGNKELSRRNLVADDFAALTTVLFGATSDAPALANDQQAKLHLNALALVTKATIRAQVIIQAVDEAAALRREKNAWTRLDDAFRSGPDKREISRVELVRIAALADINPVPLWIQHAQFMAPVLELARFGANLILARPVGGQVRLDKSLFDQALLILGHSNVWPDDTDADAAFRLVRQILESACDLDDLAAQIILQRRFDLDLILGEERDDH